MLPDVYVKNIYSNNYKLFEVFESEFQKLHQTQLKVRQFRSADEATGKTLDLIGANYNVSRGTMNDYAIKHQSCRIVTRYNHINGVDDI